MSVTFWCPEAPTQKVTPYPEEDPDFVIDESVLPEINLSNSNAVRVADLLGLGDPQERWVGTCAAPELPSVLARVDALLQPQAMLQACAQKGVPPEYLERTLTRMKALFEAAQSHGFAVSWG